MSLRPANLIRLLLVGASGSEFLLAADMAREAGAEVVLLEQTRAALEIFRQDGCDLAMVDVALDLPDLMKQLRSERIAVPVLACGVHAPAERAVAAIHAGALDYIPLPPQREMIAAAIMSLCHRVSSPVGEDPALLLAISYARAIAPSDATVLISGEPGTGKEVMARMIHEVSGRPGRFLVVECAGVASEVIESELFGHEAGAFPGALAPRLGRLAEAVEGTVLLREIGALPPVVQARLAATLQQRTARIAAEADHRLPGARLVASTTADLSAQVSAGTFRADLLALLDLLRIRIPPLRDRRDDIDRLAVHFAKRLAAINGLPNRALAPSALQSLRRYDWPGNVRELEDVIHRAVLLARGQTIESDAFVLSDGRQIDTAGDKLPMVECEMESLVGRSVADVERELILQTLKHCGGNRTTASTILGISVRTMRNKLKSFIEAGIPISPAA